jgi:Na+:H+ antiporter, NhaA family
MPPRGNRPDAGAFMVSAIVVYSVRRTSSRLAAFVVSNSVLLPIGAIIALAWANLAAASYETFARNAHFAVNDVGMTLFFALGAKEIVEATAPAGSLHPPSRAATPVLAAVGGMLVPAAVYLSLTSAMGQYGLARGWAIPSATDIAFSFLVARWLFGRSHAAVPFLLLLAIADDAIGLLVLAVFYPAGAVRPVEFILILSIALAVCWALKRLRVTHFWPYVALGGIIAWIAFFRGGLHPALALVPIVPFLPHAARDSGLFEQPLVPGRDALARFERVMSVPVEIILFLFGLVNAGIPIESIGAGTWIVLTALLAGKPLGIVVAVMAGRRFGAKLPASLTDRDVVVIGCVAGIGFTVALFFCTAAFPEGDLLDQTKMGALLSFLAALIASLAAVALRVGRFGGRRDST